MVERENVKARARVKDGVLRVDVKNEGAGGIAGGVQLYRGDKYKGKIEEDEGLVENRLVQRGINPGFVRTLSFDDVELKDDNYKFYAFTSDEPIIEFNLSDGDVVSQSGQVYHPEKDEEEKKEEVDVDELKERVEKMQKEVEEESKAIDDLRERKKELKKDNREKRERLDELQEKRDERKEDDGDESRGRTSLWDVVATLVDWLRRR